MNCCMSECHDEADYYIEYMDGKKYCGHVCVDCLSIIERIYGELLVVQLLQ